MEEFKIILFAAAILLGCILKTLGNEDFFASQFESGGTPPPTYKNNFTIGSKLARNFLEHFKNPESPNLPLPIPDPFTMPDRTYQILGFNVYTTNVSAYGVSRTKVENFTTDFVEMKVHFGLRLPKLELIGNYSLTDWFMKRYEGGFNVTLLSPQTECNAKLEITPGGELRAADIVMDLVSRDKMDIRIENAGFTGFVMNNFGETFFNAIKPYFLSLISKNIQGTMNDGLRQLRIMFPNSIAPIDLGIAEGRKFIKKSAFDPYRVPDYQYATSIYSVDVRQIVLTGLSSIYRFGDVKLTVDNNVANVVVNVETEEVEVCCTWEAGVAGILTKTGIASFTVEYVSVTASVNQSLDIRNKPRILDLKVKLGNIQLRVDGAGVLDYVAESGVNVLPNMLRYQIMQAAEVPMKRKVQEALDDVELEQLIMDRLPMLDQQLHNRHLSVIEDNFVEEDATVKSTGFDEELIF